MSDENKNKIIKNKWIIIIVIFIIVSLGFIVYDTLYQEDEKTKENLENTNNNYSDVDRNFYLQDGKLFVFDRNNNPIQVPGDFSQMKEADYDEENHQANTSIGNVYFYYKLNEKIYLVISNNTNFDDWTTKELTSNVIGIPSGSKIKYIRISGNYGYIFYINPEGIGKILKSTTEGEYWSEIRTDLTLNDNCTLKFLNEFGMTVDGFLTVPSKDGQKCDLYRVDDMNEQTFEKIDVSDANRNFAYYSMPKYLDNSGMAIVMEVKVNKDDTDIFRYISTDDGENWKTEAEYQNQKSEEEEKNKELINRYNQMVDKLDKNVYLIDFEDYNVNSNEINISEKNAKEIAEIGFKESASRIAGEGIDDTEEESIEIQEVNANNYFTRKYNEGDKVYTNIKRKAYVVTKENSMGNGVKVYVDVTTGLIIGGAAFGD